MSLDVKAWELSAHELLHAQRGGVNSVAAAQNAQTLWHVVAWLRDVNHLGICWCTRCLKARELEQAAIATGYAKPQQGTS